MDLSAHADGSGRKAYVLTSESILSSISYGSATGVLSVPIELAPKLPAVVDRILEKERKLIGLCRVGDFSIEKLRDLVKETI